MLFVVSVGDECDLMATGIALLVIDKGMQVITLEEVLRTALTGKVILVSVRVIDERNFYTLIGLVFYCLIEEELQRCGVSHDLSDLVAVLKGGKKVQLALMLAIEVIDLIVGWGKEQSSFFKVELDLRREVLVLCGNVKQCLTRGWLAVNPHLNGKVDNMPVLQQQYHFAIIPNQCVLIIGKRLREGHGEVQTMRPYQSRQLGHGNSDIMWIEVAKDNDLSLHPLFIFLIPKVHILQSTASHLLTLI